LVWRCWLLLVASCAGKTKDRMRHFLTRKAALDRIPCV
jgi:hypothetical protein